MQGTEGFGFDATEIEGWIDSLGIAFAGPLRFERIGLGQSNLTFRVSDEQGKRWVLRRPPLGPLLPSAHDVGREARILSALEDTDVPTPQVHGVKEFDAVPHVLLEFVDGPVIDRRSAAESLPAQRRRAVGMSLTRTLARVHDVDLDRSGLADLAGHRPYAERQLKRWVAQWENSKTRELPALDALTGRLLAAIPVERDTTLVHGDFHLRNVVTARYNGEIAAVLDWELSTLGDPLADLGSLLAYWQEPGDALGVDLSVSALPGFPSRDEIAAAYLAETGRDPEALAFWHALGLWKIAVICEGVLHRALAEPCNRAVAGAPTAQQVESIVTAATDVANAAGL